MPLAIAVSVDWRALSAIAGTLVFLGTVALAISTWKMVRAARDQANAAKDQADAARAQAAASAQLADIARRQLAVSSSAAIRVLADDGRASVSYTDTRSDWGDEPEWAVVIYNSGEAPAMTERATLHLPGLSGRAGSLQGRRDSRGFPTQGPLRSSSDRKACPWLLSQSNP